MIIISEHGDYLVTNDDDVFFDKDIRQGTHIVYQYTEYRRITDGVPDVKYSHIKFFIMGQLPDVKDPREKKSDVRI